MTEVWIKIDQCDNTFLGAFTKEERLQHDFEQGGPSPNGYYWERWVIVGKCDLVRDRTVEK